jgi:hypothetical protein
MGIPIRIITSHYGVQWRESHLNCLWLSLFHNIYGVRPMMSSDKTNIDSDNQRRGDHMKFVSVQVM